jgi:AT hook motif
MAFDPKTYQDGFTAGWLAAFRAISEATTDTRSTSIPLAMAANAPARRRGRPPKSESAAQPVKRRRGRPRKAEAK